MYFITNSNLPALLPLITHINLCSFYQFNFWSSNSLCNFTCAQFIWSFDIPLVVKSKMLLFHVRSLHQASISALPEQFNHLAEAVVNVSNVTMQNTFRVGVLEDKKKVKKFSWRVCLLFANVCLGKCLSCVFSLIFSVWEVSYI